MSNLTDLVPPLELCQKIPAGEFEDSAFIWDKTTSIGFWDGEDKNGNQIGGFGKIPHKKYRLRQNYSERCRKHIKDQDIELDIFPAPTLQEIMVELPELTEAFKNDFDGKRTLWMVGESNYETTPVVAALKFWFMLKGIENE